MRGQGGHLHRLGNKSLKAVLINYNSNASQKGNIMDFIISLPPLPWRARDIYINQNP